MFGSRTFETSSLHHIHGGKWASNSLFQRQLFPTSTPRSFRTNVAVHTSIMKCKLVSVTSLCGQVHLPLRGGHGVRLTQIPMLRYPSIVFLQALPALLETHIGFIGNVYGFANIPNARTHLCFYEIALRDSTSCSANVYAKQTVAWVVGKVMGGQPDGSGVKGGMGFCRPTFWPLRLVDRDLAERTYLENEMAFHPIAKNLTEKVSVDTNNCGFHFVSLWMSAMNY